MKFTTYIIGIVSCIFFSCKLSIVDTDKSNKDIFLIDLFGLTKESNESLKATFNINPLLYFKNDSSQTETIRLSYRCDTSLVPQLTNLKLKKDNGDIVSLTKRNDPHNEIFLFFNKITVTVLNSVETLKFNERSNSITFFFILTKELSYSVDNEISDTIKVVYPYSYLISNKEGSNIFKIR